MCPSPISKNSRDVREGTFWLESENSDPKPMDIDQTPGINLLKKASKFNDSVNVK
jgi:hypothetical protein